MKICNLDFETGSRADLTKVGVYNYVAHPSTRVHVLKYTFDHGRHMKTWHVAKGDPLPADLDAALDDPEVMFEGWNVAFERLVFRDVLDIEIPIKRFRCTMARARAMALPGSLELCGRALDTDIQKGDDTAMKLWMRPLSPHAKSAWATPETHPESYDDLCHYCQLDVITEIEIGERLRDLTEEEWEDYQVNEQVNDRGLPVDIDLAKAAQGYAEDEIADIAKKLAAMTDGVVTSPKQHARIKIWLNARLPPELQFKPDENGKVSFDRAARDELMAPDNDGLLSDEAREFVQLVHDGGRASTSKFAAMQAQASSDGRVRGAYVFNGAGQTHRFSSRGLQVHNFVRAKLPDPEPVIEALLADAPANEVLSFTGIDNIDMMTVLSRCLRPAIVAEPGKQLVWGDWEQIEARVLPWLSAQNSASELLDAFARGEDVYRRQAALTYKIDLDQVTKEQRQNGGKIPVLSFGFGGGVGAIFNMARAYGVRVTEDAAQELKHAWRDSNPWAMRFWNDLEKAARDAVNNPGEQHLAGRVTYYSTEEVLWAILPSGRVLAYPDPRVEEIETQIGVRPTVTCMKGSFRPKQHQKDWPRMRLWGGIQAENVTQAEAASVLRYGARELVRNGWPLVGHTHDELLLEVFDDEVDEAKAALHDIMTHPPACFAGLPLAAEVSAGPVYGK